MNEMYFVQNNSREEQLRAKGLSSADIEASRSSSRADPEVMEIAPPPPPAGGKSAIAGSTATQQKRGVASVKKPEPVVINDKDLPSSTPIPPPLNVPIVTHSARPSEGIYSLNIVLSIEY